MIKRFIIQKTKLNANIKNLNKKKINIKSFPRDYNIEFDNNSLKFIKLINKKNAVIIIDSNIFNKYYSGKIIKNKNIIKINANEKNKDLKTINKIINFFVKKNITKSNKVYAIGGGIIQDLAGYSSLIYRRGLHWEYIPTTFLGMTDSCLGGKVGVNFGNAKNLIALFSAPRKVIINTNYLNTLSYADLLSGLGEALRLHLTGGTYFVKEFIKNIDGAIRFNQKNLNIIIKNSLVVKKAVVEEDEYEFDIRRSMNFGHSYGHALEVLCNHAIPHGTAVAIGMCIERILCSKKFKINKEVSQIILTLALRLITKKNYTVIKKLNLRNLNNIMQKDKKTLNGVIKFAVPNESGNMKFYNQKLNKQNITELIEANKIFINTYEKTNNLN